MSGRTLSLVLFAALASGTALAAGADDLDDLDPVAWDDDDLDDELDLERGGKAEPTGTDLLDDDLLGDEPIEDFELVPDLPGGVDDEPDELNDFGILEDPDDISIAQPERKTVRAPAPAGPGAITLDVAGKDPLADNYPLTVIAVDRDAVVVELPVLIARSRVGVEKGFAVYADIYVGDKKVTEVRQLVEPPSLAEFGPSFAFIKALAPVVERQGEIRVVLSTSALDGTGRTELFTRVTPYSLR